jgi:hypothetical protein
LYKVVLVKKSVVTIQADLKIDTKDVLEAVESVILERDE